MGLAFANNSVKVVGGGSILNATLPNPTQAGSLGVCFVCYSNGGLSGPPTDSQGATWCQVAGFGDNLGGAFLFVQPNLAAGAETVTVSFGTTPSSVMPCVAVMEYKWPSPAKIFSFNPFIFLGDFPGPSNMPGPPYVMEAIYAQFNAGVAVPFSATIIAGILDLSNNIHAWQMNSLAGTRESTDAANSFGVGDATFTASPITASFTDPGITSGDPYQINSLIGFILVFDE